MKFIMPYLIVFALLACSDYLFVRYAVTAYKGINPATVSVCWHCDLDANAKWGGIF